MNTQTTTRAAIARRYGGDDIGRAAVRILEARGVLVADGIGRNGVTQLRVAGTLLSRRAARQLALRTYAVQPADAALRLADAVRLILRRSEAELAHVRTHAPESARCGALQHAVEHLAGFASAVPVPWLAQRTALPVALYGVPPTGSTGRQPTLPQLCAWAGELVGRLYVVATDCAGSRSTAAMERTHAYAVWLLLLQRALLQVGIRLRGGT